MLLASAGHNHGDEVGKGVAEDVQLTCVSETAYTGLRWCP